MGGLTIILEKGLSNVRIETDLIEAVQLIKWESYGHPQQALVAAAQILMAPTEAVLSHIY